MDEPSALKLRMRSFSITRTEVLIAFPAPSRSLPKRSALIEAADLDAGQTPNRMARDERMIIEILTLRIGCIPLFNGRSPSMNQYAIEKKALCRWRGVEVPKGRRSFCSDDCVHEHKLRRCVVGLMNPRHSIEGVALPLSFRRQDKDVIEYRYVPAIRGVIMLKPGGSDYQGWCVDSPNPGGIVTYRF